LDDSVFAVKASLDPTALFLVSFVALAINVAVLVYHFAKVIKYKRNIAVGVHSDLGEYKALLAEQVDEPPESQPKKVRPGLTHVLLLVLVLLPISCTTTRGVDDRETEVQRPPAAASIEDEVTAEAAQAGSTAPSSSELAKEISNPVTSLWQLQFQFNNMQLESSDTPVSREKVNNLYFQPVLPASLTDDWNLITRPVITLYNSVPVPTGPSSSEQETTFGDTTLATVLSPAGTEPWIFGVGPTFIFPTAEEDATGQGKWQAGPAIGGGYITDKFMIAAFGQQWWSFAGESDRDHTNQLSLLPLIYRFWGDGWSVGYSGNILADWSADSDEQWTIPLGLSVAKVVWFGKLPVQVQVGGQYFVERPTGGPEWNFQIQLTPVIPRLIKKPLFE
jgi:hypothetical protein